MTRWVSRVVSGIFFDMKNKKATYSLHGGRWTRLYKVWAGIKQRCTNKNEVCYKHYGGRGINYCDEWKNFKPFMEWALANGYKDHLTIDRIKGNLGYSPDNCRWVTRKIQAINQKTQTNSLRCPGVRKTKNGHFQARISVNGKSMVIGTFKTIKEASKAYQKAKKARNTKYHKEEGLT